MTKRPTKFARDLRLNPTDAEKKLWLHLRKDQLGVRFRRQLSIGPYIVDFCAPEQNLIIELDGGQHNEDVDKKRNDFIKAQGYKILRYWNNEIFENLDGIIEDIMSNLKNPLSLNPSPQGERETAVVGAGEVIEIIHGEVKPSNLNALRVRGGNRLKGEIKISGAKNAALKHMCAALLTDQPMEFTNMPVTLGDVRTLSELLDYLGMSVALRSDGVAMLHAKEIKTTIAPYDLVRKMRASVLVLGPLLARCGQADISMPGGCAIGTRPVDLHLKGFEAMGATIELDGGYIKARAPKGGLKGAHITFPFVSVGATENIMMAATLANGITVLSNAAREPEIVDQGNALIKMGAKIEGLGTSEIRIEGVKSLSGTTHSCIPDRIETGTYMCAVGLTGGEVRLKNASLESLAFLVAPLIAAGMEIKQDGNDVFVYRNGNHLNGVDIMTAPYPGFATDLQAQFMAMMTMCKGAGMITETVFENRFMHVPELCRMGANITVQGNSAIIRGVDKLKGAEVMATDLRASVALVLAGLVAEGETIVNRIYHLERGYENIVEKLGGVGADIERVSER